MLIIEEHYVEGNLHFTVYRDCNNWFLKIAQQWVLREGPFKLRRDAYLRMLEVVYERSES